MTAIVLSLFISSYQSVNIVIKVKLRASVLAPRRQDASFLVLIFATVCATMERSTVIGGMFCILEARVMLIINVPHACSLHSIDIRRFSWPLNVHIALCFTAVHVRKMPQAVARTLSAHLSSKLRNL